MGSQKRATGKLLSISIFLVVIRSFLGHAGFYRRFIKDFSKISRPLTNLLQKDVPFVFDDDCVEAIEILKKALNSAPIIQPPDTSPSYL